jgi:hypothetical protein
MFPCSVESAKPNSRSRIRPIGHDPLRGADPWHRLHGRLPPALQSMGLGQTRRPGERSGGPTPACSDGQSPNRP